MALATFFRKAAKRFVYKHLSDFGASKTVFFERLKSVDFEHEKLLKRYVYSGFNDFLFLEKEALGDQQRSFFIRFRIRLKIAQMLRI